MADALEKTKPPLPSSDGTQSSDTQRLQDGTSQTSGETDRGPASPEPGEGIGLSIVKRLCDMLDATIELKTEHDVGTSFRILFPRHYTT
jgi:signal transduction histidine kinase